MTDYLTAGPCELCNREGRREFMAGFNLCPSCVKEVLDVLGRSGNLTLGQVVDEVRREMPLDH
jgi:hypothetical protein